MVDAFGDAEFRLCDTCDKVYVVKATPHVCAPQQNLRVEHPGAFNKCLRKWYFPLLVRFSVTGITVPKTKCTPSFIFPWLGLAWLVLTGFCAGFGPGFLSNTRSGLDVPPGTPTATAIDVLDAHYPSASSWPPAIVLHQMKPGYTGTIIQSNSTIRMSEILANFQASHSTVSGVSGYFELMSKRLPVLADLTLSADKRSMISTISIAKGAELKDVTDMVHEALELVNELEFSDITVGLTGIFPLFGEMQEATEANFGMIDGIALPVCIIILGLNLRSYKHMVIALVNLAVTLLLSFTIILPISNAVDINPFSPSIMMSLGIAVCFDYTLFMLNRFREAVVLEGYETEAAVLSALETAGHVIALSGSTLFATFILLLIFPQNFLQSVGWSCSAVVVSAIIVNLSITPMLLLSVKPLTSFEALPACLTPAKPINWRACCKRQAESEKRDIPTDDIIPTQTSPSAPSSSPSDPSSSSTSAASPSSSSPAPSKEFSEYMQREGRSCWFKITWAVTKYPFLALLLALGSTAGFVYLWSTMVVTSDDTILFLQGSRSLETLIDMRESFDEGQLNPFSMVMVTTGGLNGSVLTPDYFSQENALLNSLIAQQPQYIAAKSITALSFFAARNISFMEAMGFLQPNSSTYNSTTAASYRLSAGSLMNARQSATLVRISPLINPNSQAIVPFIDHTRAVLARLDGTIRGYLFGAYSSDYDVQNALGALTPYLYASTIIIVLIIVGTSFESLMISLRLAITIIVSLAWTYGLMALVYQPGPGNTAFAVIGPSLIHSTGIYWIIPIMSFSILVGLALDYDIFLMSRVLEFRRAGWSDRASICLAVEKTGGIITSAGVIMAVSFAGLLFPNTIVLNQYGFSLCIGVTLDTFLVRTVLVPAVFTAFAKPHVQANWWPGKMPRPFLDQHTEYEVLLAGYWSPPATWPIRKP